MTLTYLLMMIMQSLLIPCTLPVSHWFVMALCAQHAQITMESPIDCISLTICRKQNFARSLRLSNLGFASIPPSSRWIRNSQNPLFSLSVFIGFPKLPSPAVFPTDRKPNVSIGTFNKKR